MKKKASTFAKTRARLKGAEPASKQAHKPVRNKRKRLFSKSVDIHEDRAVRQMKTAQGVQTFPHVKS